MSDLVVFVVIVAAMAGVGMALGIIVAGRMDRLIARPDEEPTTTTPTTPAAPLEPTDVAEPPAPAQEDQS